MLGRHVYRVHAAAAGWTVTKEGETEPRGNFDRCEEAVAEACRLAKADAPSRVVVDNGDGVLLAEHLFGSDLAQDLAEKTEPGTG